ncbi:MAG: TM2 domain-containing protein, partial [Coleofasciculaceae cyanobacterium]
MLSKPKNRRIAALLAFAGTVAPVSGLHKFYLGQPLWGILYLLLWGTHIPQIACAIEGVWYLAQGMDEFDRNFNLGAVPEDSKSTATVAIDPAQVGAV